MQIVTTTQSRFNQEFRVMAERGNWLAIGLLAELCPRRLWEHASAFLPGVILNAYFERRAMPPAMAELWRQEWTEHASAIRRTVTNPERFVRTMAMIEKAADRHAKRQKNKRHGSSTIRCNGW